MKPHYRLRLWRYPHAPSRKWLWAVSTEKNGKRVMTARLSTSGLAIGEARAGRFNYSESM